MTLIVHFVRRDGKMIVHCIANNALLSTIKCFAWYMFISICILWILTIPIDYFLGFSIFIFTEIMSRLEKRRKPWGFFRIFYTIRYEKMFAYFLKSIDIMYYNLYNHFEIKKSRMWLPSLIHMIRRWCV